MLPKITKLKILNQNSWNLIGNSKIIWKIYGKIFQNFPPSIRFTEIAITAKFSTKQVSSLQKFIPFTLDLKWRLKSQNGKSKKFQKIFIYNTKYDSHNRVPKMGLEHKCISFWLNLRNSSNTTITLSIEPELRRFKRNLKDNTMNYLSTKNHNFSMGWSLPV